MGKIVMLSLSERSNSGSVVICSVAWDKSFISCPFIATFSENQRGYISLVRIGGYNHSIGIPFDQDGYKCIVKAR